MYGVIDDTTTRFSTLHLPCRLEATSHAKHKMSGNGYRPVILILMASLLIYVLKASLFPVAMKVLLANKCVRVTLYLKH
jgi:hypothetical protein